MTATIEDVPREELGMLGRSPFSARLSDAHVSVRVKLPPPERIETFRVRGLAHRFALPITFTPFASKRPCSARCIFCSETLVAKNSHVLSATLRPGPDYFPALRRTIEALREVPLGISLSGLESTDDADFLLSVLDAVSAHEQTTSKVLYTNGNGLTRATHGARLHPALAAFGLTRTEMSRHHYDEDRNASIMRFRTDMPAASGAVFEQTIRDTLEWVPVRLVCVLQERGVSRLNDVEAYLAWAAELGVTDVVFRELSRLGDLYEPNVTYRTVEAERVGIEALLSELWHDGAPRPDFVPELAIAGYYYWNVRFCWRDRVTATFETSDYVEMKARHESGVIHKLVFHANGNLCADWDPEKEIVLRNGELPC